MKEGIDELKEGTAATSVNPKPRRRKMQTFNDVTEAIDYYKSKSIDSKLSTRQKQRYKSMYNFAVKPGRTLLEIYKKIGGVREEERLRREADRKGGSKEKKKEKGRGPPGQIPNDNGLGALTEQASKKKKRAEYVNLEKLATKEDILKALEEKKAEAPENYKKSLQTFIKKISNPDITLTDVREIISNRKRMHNIASKESQKRLRLRKKISQPSDNTTAPIQTSSKPRSSNLPTSARPQTLPTQTSPKSQSPNMRTSPNSNVREIPRSQSPVTQASLNSLLLNARKSENSLNSNAQEVQKSQSSVIQRSPKSESPNIKTSPKSPSPHVQGTPKSQSPKNKERRDSNESIPWYLYDGVDSEEDWMSVWGLDYE